MPSFYSPTGNIEVWKEKPAGYFTPDEWFELHPSPEPDPPSTEELFMRLRFERNQRLAGSDYLLMPDYIGVNDEIKLKVVAYRKALRDLPEQDGAPWDGGGPETPWPVAP